MRWVRSAWHRVHGYFVRAPASLVFLFTLFVTWWSLQGTDHRTLHKLVVSASTNLHNMSRDPFQVLLVSAFWQDGTSFPWMTVAEFLLVMVAAERWLGSGRWVLTFVAGHGGATLITVVGVAWALNHDLLPAKLAGTVDVGASYGFWAVTALFTFRFTRRAWRWWSVSVIVGFLAVMAWHGQTFTDYGHLAAVLIGLSLYRICPRPDDGTVRDKDTGSRRRELVREMLTKSNSEYHMALKTPSQRQDSSRRRNRRNHDRQRGGSTTAVGTGTSPQLLSGIDLLPPYVADELKPGQSHTAATRLSPNYYTPPNATAHWCSSLPDP